ncbi:hypothetical protein [Streptomyces sp. NPDC056227]
MTYSRIRSAATSQPGRYPPPLAGGSGADDWAERNNGSAPYATHQ